MLRFRYQQDIIEFAETIAHQCTDVFFRHGCVIVDKNDRLLSTGSNFSYGGYIRHGRFTEHAETNAIKSAIRRYGKKVLIGAKLYVVKLSPAGVKKPSNPCEQCSYHIRRAGISFVYFYERTEPVHHDTANIIRELRKQNRNYNKVRYLGVVHKCHTCNTVHTRNTKCQCNNSSKRRQSDNNAVNE